MQHLKVGKGSGDETNVQVHTQTLMDTIPAHVNCHGTETTGDLSHALCLIHSEVH